jgi:hypothetical protein
VVILEHRTALNCIFFLSPQKHGRRTEANTEEATKSIDSSQSESKSKSREGKPPTFSINHARPASTQARNNASSQAHKHASTPAIHHHSSFFFKFGSALRMNFRSKAIFLMMLAMHRQGSLLMKKPSDAVVSGSKSSIAS